MTFSIYSPPKVCLITSHARLTKIKDTRLKTPDQYRLRYTIYLPDSGRRDLSRRYRTYTTGRAKHEVATVLEHRTRQLLQGIDDIQIWQNEDLISPEEAERLDLTPPAHRKTLRKAMEEYRATWEVSPGEALNRDIRVRVIEEILGPDSPIVSLDYGAGEGVGMVHQGLDAEGIPAAAVVSQEAVGHRATPRSRSLG